MAEATPLERCSGETPTALIPANGIERPPTLTGEAGEGAGDLFRHQVKALTIFGLGTRLGPEGKCIGAVEAGQGGAPESLSGFHLLTAQPGDKIAEGRRQARLDGSVVRHAFRALSFVKMMLASVGFSLVYSG